MLPGDAVPATGIAARGAVTSKGVNDPVTMKTDRSGIAPMVDDDRAGVISRQTQTSQRHAVGLDTVNGIRSNPYAGRGQLMPLRVLKLRLQDCTSTMGAQVRTAESRSTQG